MASPIQHIFLDIDGVLADFTGATTQLHGRQEILNSWPSGERDIPKVLGISRSEYWRKIDDAGPGFWEELKPYPWFEDLIALARETAPFTLLTAPSLSPHSLAGKVAWIYRHFPKVAGKRFGDFLIGRQKHLLAAPGRVLIDDAEHNVEAFRQAGGAAILFPQIWNANHASTDPVNFVRKQLEEGEI